MPVRRSRTVLRRTALILAAAIPLAAAGCIRHSGGTWYVRSAATPADWPELTPIDEVQVKTYPAYRAVVAADDAGDPDARGDADRAAGRRMFGPLFQHIKAEGIPMTAPVEMGYAAGPPEAPRMDSMAFLYPATDVGTPDPGDGDADGDGERVRVVDVPARPHATVGVRGGYVRRNFERGLERLEAWLADQAEWRADGPPRYLGYNGPFTPSFMRYGEVQIPVAPAN